MASNFEFMASKWHDIAVLGAEAEECSATQPRQCAELLGRIGERIADELLTINGLTLPDDSTQSEKIAFLRSHQLIIISIEDILLSLDDKAEGTEITAEEAENRLRMAHKLCHWFVLVHGYSDAHGNSSEREAPAAEEESESEAPAAEEDSESEAPAAEEDSESEAPAAEEESEGEATEAENNGKIHIDVNFLPVVNYALLQNGLRIIRSLTIVNESEESVADAELRITSEPAFCLP